MFKMSDQGPEPLVLFLSLLLYLGFELSFCSMDFPADITLRKTRMKFELTFKVVLLFSYQGFVFLTQLLHFIILRSLCQELFYFIFRCLLLFFLSNSFILSYFHLPVKHFLFFVLYFPNKSEKYY